MKCGGVQVLDGTRHCFVEERGLGTRAFGEGQLRASEDHYVPKSMGGSDSPDNLHLAHFYCQAVQGGFLAPNKTSEQYAKMGRAGGLAYKSLVTATPEGRARGHETSKRLGVGIYGSAATHSQWHVKAGKPCTCP
jgi:hypothetical protein